MYWVTEDLAAHSNEVQFQAVVNMQKILVSTSVKKV